MKNWSVKVQVSSNEFKMVEVQAANFKQAWAEAQKQQSGVVCDVKKAN